MTILDETRALLAGQKDKLQSERDRLVGERDNLTAQISEVDALLRQIAGIDRERAPRAASTSSGRRSGIRDDVLAAIKNGAGTPAAIRTALNLSGKSASQSVS